MTLQGEGAAVFAAGVLATRRHQIDLRPKPIWLAVNGPATPLGLGRQNLLGLDFPHTPALSCKMITRTKKGNTLVLGLPLGEWELPPPLRAATAAAATTTTTTATTATTTTTTATTTTTTATSTATAAATTAPPLPPHRRRYHCTAAARRRRLPEALTTLVAPTSQISSSLLRSGWP